MANEVRIELTVDEKGAVNGVRSLGAVSKEAAAAVSQLDGQMKAAGATAATAGAKVETAMNGIAAATSKASAQTTAYQARLKALYDQVTVFGAAQRKVFNEQVMLFSKQGLAPLEAQEQALKRTAQILEQQAAAARSAGAGYGEARIAMGALTGSARMMEMGLANVGARLKFLQPLWDAALPVALGLGMVGIVVQMGEAVYDLYEKWLDTDGAIDRYNQKAAEAAEKQFFQNSGLDQLNADLQTATKSLDDLQKKKAGSLGVLAYGLAASSGLYEPGQGPPPLYTMADANKQNTAQGEVNQATLRKDELDHRRAIQHLQDEALKREAELTGQAKAQAEYEERIAEAKENQRFRRQYDTAQAAIINRGKKPGDEGYVSVVPNAGQTEEQDAAAHAQAQLAAARIQNERQHAQELARIHEQALESGLKGEALLAQREAAALADLREKGIATAQAIHDVETRFHNERMMQIQQEQQQADKALRAAMGSGLTGIARIDAERNARIADISSNTSITDPIARLKLYAAANFSADQQIAAEKQTFTDRIDELADQSASHQIDGFARIRAEAKKQIDALERDYQKIYGKDPGNPQYQAHVGELNRGIGIINAGADSDAASLRQRNSDETARIEMEARARSLNAERQQTAAIVAEYEERTHQYFEQLQKQQISQDDYNRRMIAAAQVRDAEIVENQRREREKMASEFTRFFRNPVNALKEMGDKAAGEMAASLTQRFEQRISGAHQSHTPLSGDFGLEAFWSRVTGVPHGGSPGARAERVGTHEAAPGVFTVATAHIVVGSAAISFGATSTNASMPMLSGGSGFAAERVPSLRLPAGMPMLADFRTPAGSTAASSLPFTGGASAGMPSVSSGSSSLLGNLQQGESFGTQAFSLFGGTRGKNALGGPDVQNNDLADMFHFGKNGELVKNDSTNGGMLTGGGFKSNIGGTVGGALGLYSAYESNGGVGGALSGAMGGMKLGMAVGGPVGAAIGAAAGAVIGAFGVGGRERARMYDLRTVRPKIAEDMASYQNGGGAYLSIYSDLQSLDMDAKKQTNRLGPAAQRYYQDVIKGEIKQAEGRLDGEERAGRHFFSETAAQFATGTDRIPRDAYAYLHKGEAVFTADRTERMTRAMESGADLASIARNYRAALSSSSTRQPVSTGDRTLNMNVYAHDSRSVAQFFHANKHIMRAALNASYAENSGGADA